MAGKSTANCFAWATVGLVLTEDGWRPVAEVDAEKARQEEAKKAEAKAKLVAEKEAESAKLAGEAEAAQIAWETLSWKVYDLQHILAALDAKARAAEQAYVDTSAKRAEVLEELKKLTE